MTNITPKTAGLLMLALFSSPTMAASPWANDPVAAEPVSIEPSNNEPVETEPMPVTQYETGRPGMEDEPAPVAEPVAAPEPIVNTQTQRQGDVLNVSNTTPVASVNLLNFPRRGMSTDKVENELGRPSEIISAIGTPPISRWVYDDRTVYFEYATVIHVVAK